MNVPVERHLHPAAVRTALSFYRGNVKIIGLDMLSETAVF